MANGVIKTFPNELRFALTSSGGVAFYWTDPNLANRADTAITQMAVYAGYIEVTTKNGTKYRANLTPVT